MGKSRAEIRMDYLRAKRQAEELSGIAKAIRRNVGTNFENCINDIVHNWNSSNSREYTEKCNLLKQNLEADANKLEKAARTIIMIAEKTYNAEMTALSIAEMRTF